MKKECIFHIQNSRDLVNHLRKKNQTCASGTFKGQLLLLDQDGDWLSHELGGYIHDISRHGSREQHNLHIVGEEPEDIVDLVLETTWQHLISLIKNEHLDVLRLWNDLTITFSRKIQKENNRKRTSVTISQLPPGICNIHCCIVFINRSIYRRLHKCSITYSTSPDFPRSSGLFC